MGKELSEITGCDCHIHIYDLVRFPIEQTDPVSPPAGSWTDYKKLQSTLGLNRCVLIQPMGYGLDNACILDALSQAQGSARAIVSLAPKTSMQRLTQLAAAGVVGVRFQLVQGDIGAMTWANLPRIAREIADLGWHINLQMDGRLFPEREALLRELACPVVIDHTGKFLEPAQVGDEAFTSLRRLLDTGRFHIKLSAPYETSRVGPPDYSDVGLLAKALARDYTERCLWASNWPHPTQALRPDESQLLQLLDEWAPTRQARTKILCENPATLYGF